MVPLCTPPTIYNQFKLEEKWWNWDKERERKGEWDAAAPVLCKDRKLLYIIIIKYSYSTFRPTNLIGVLGDDGGVEREGPRAAVELLAGGGRSGGGLSMSRLRRVAIHETSDSREICLMLCCNRYL